MNGTRINKVASHPPDSDLPYRVDCSVPQGSVLGQKEFIAYTEELAVLIDSYQLGQAPVR